VCEVCEVRRGTHSNDEKRPQAWPSWQRLGACAAGAAPFAHTYAICNLKPGQVTLGALERSVRVEAAMLLPSLAPPPCARATKAAHRRRPAVAALPRATRRKTGPRRPDRDDLGHDFARAGPLALASERHWQVSDALGRAGPILCARAR
jgi:hypothetical protein